MMAFIRKQLRSLGGDSEGVAGYSSPGKRFLTESDARDAVGARQPLAGTERYRHLLLSMLYLAVADLREARAEIDLAMAQDTRATGAGYTRTTEARRRVVDVVRWWREPFRPAWGGDGAFCGLSLGYICDTIAAITGRDTLDAESIIREIQPSIEAAVEAIGAADGFISYRRRRLMNRSRIPSANTSTPAAP